MCTRNVQNNHLAGPKTPVTFTVHHPKKLSPDIECALTPMAFKDEFLTTS